MFNTGCSEEVELSSFVRLLVLVPVSVPLSYECAVYFLIKNVHFVLSSVEVAALSGHFLQLHKATPSVNYYDMLCSLCKICFIS